MDVSLWLFFALIPVLAAAIQMPTNQNFPTLFLVPAYAASKLFARWEEKTDLPAECCTSNKEWWLVYPSPFFNKCRLPLYFPVLNESSGIWGSAANVSITPTPYDSTDLETMQCLGSPSPTFCDIGAYQYQGKYTEFGYFQLLIQTMEGWGYKVGVNLFGAAYDWRFVPDSPVLDSFYKNWRLSIESSVNTTGNKVCLLGHSYGNLIVKYFLEARTTKVWKDKYIDSAFYVGAPWGGAVKTTMEVTSGEHIWLFMDAVTVRNFNRNASSMAAVLPSPEVFDKEYVFASINSVDYKMKDMEKYLHDVGDNYSYITYARWYSKTRIARPDVQSYCIQGNDLPTPTKYNYLDFAEPVKVIMGTGDGVVNQASLDVCKTWAALPGPQVTTKELPRVDHVAILREDVFFDYLLQVLKKKASGRQPTLRRINLIPVLRTVVKDRQRELCFTQHPVLQCPPQAIRTKNAGWLNTPFVCFAKDSSKAYHLNRRSMDGEAFHLLAYNATYSELMDIPAECNRLRFG